MATDLSTLLGNGTILAIGEATSRKQAIVALADALALKLGVDARMITDAVMEREQLGSTGVGDGVAIPHARIDGISVPVGGFMRLSTAVDFDAVDERPCDLIFMLLAPMDAGADHLRALAQVSRAFRQPALRERLRGATTESEIEAALCQRAEDASAA
ncbi:MAG: PTS sugar transporter subunit IIA [Pseudomonadota bacterium]